VVARINSRVTQIGQIGELSIPKYHSFVAGKQNFCEQRQNAPTMKRVEGRYSNRIFRDRPTEYRAERRRVSANDVDPG
jgi:hypothetical protein